MSEARNFTPVLGEGGNVNYIRPKALAEEGTTGVVVEGVYEGTIPNKFDNTKNDYKVIDGEGTLNILNSCGSLNYQLGKVASGSYVRISYKGMEKLKSGKDAHAFIVEVAD